MKEKHIGELWPVLFFIFMLGVFAGMFLAAALELRMT
jgi:hypothetical protein